jgi:hypothetical protein
MGMIFSTNTLDLFKMLNIKGANMEPDEYCEICGISSEQLEAQDIVMKSVASCSVMGFNICIDCCFAAGGPYLEDCNGCGMGKQLENPSALKY